MDNLRPDSNAIILLDEDLGKRKGTYVAQRLLGVWPKLTIASITGGRKPEFAELHFQGKKAVATDRESAVQFVKFMNKILARAEHA
jgi:hypothetical protein